MKNAYYKLEDSMFYQWIRICRPLQWVKNLFVCAPLLFAKRIFDLELCGYAFVAFVLFCAFSSSVYAINDVFDIERDRAHPLKSRRPVACGQIQPRAAFVGGIFLASIGLAGAFVLNVRFGLIGSVYIGINLIYSAWLKRIAFVDVVLIACGFVLRVVGGAVAIGVDFSFWLIACTFSLACLLGFGKRCHELKCVSTSLPTRQVLGVYTHSSLRVANYVAAGITLLVYLFYTLAPGTVAKVGTYELVFTLPFPAMGILRYLQLVKECHSTSPTDDLISDISTWVNLCAWVIAVVLVLYDVL